VKLHSGALLKIGAIFAVALLLYWTVGGDFNAVSEAILKANANYLVTSTLIYGIALYLTCVRWHLLIRCSGIDISHLEVISLHYSGHFFNTTTPGAVSGDILKMAAILKYAPEKRVAGTMSILIDRLIGLAALIFVVLVMLIPAWSFLADEKSKEIHIAALIVGMGALVFLFCGILFLFRKTLIKTKLIQKIIGLIERKFPRILIAFTEIERAILTYKNHRKTLIGLMILSVIVHFLLGLSFYTLGLSLGLSVSPVLFILSMQISNALAAIFPLPGGLGLRDRIGKSFLLAAGVSSVNSSATPLLYTAVILFWSLVGAACFITRQLRKKAN
jgi:glycosyltransferase 2 family protein